MWASNGLRLRRGLSAGVRHVTSLRWQSSASLPVSEKEFLGGLKDVGIYQPGNIPPFLGLAISGGVDSMALAALYNRAWERHRSWPKAHGIIIDHKMRPESTEEAQWVSEQLRAKFGMNSSIVPLVWPESPDLNNRSSFETDARRLRYQALGTKCRDLRIRNLLVAHHGDDQVETVMIRLINGRLRSGLTGMSATEWIPECYGIYGVHYSGEAFHDTESHLPFPIETGGIQVHRPLLAFEKSRLIATCQELDVQWAEDRTNKDPTVTGRNAVRNVYQNHKLPEALDRQSLITLSRRMEERVSNHEQAAMSAFNTTLLKLDIQTASLNVRFPSSADLLGRSVETESDRVNARNTAYLFIQNVVDLVSPKEKRSIGQLSIAVDNLYPNLRGKDDALETQESFTVSGILFRVWDRPSVFASAEEFPRLHDREYHLCRQPFDAREKDDVFLEIAPAAVDPDGRKKWHYFDGRFWIRVANLTERNLTIRTLGSDDLRHLNSVKLRDHQAPYRFIKAALDTIKPGELRKTIPAIFRNEDGHQTLVALPTLGVSVAHPTVSVKKEICTWDVHYKKVTLPEGFAMKDMVNPGVKRDDMMEKLKPFQKKTEKDNIRIKRISPMASRPARDENQFGRGGRQYTMQRPSELAEEYNRKMKRLQITMQRPPERVERHSRTMETDNVGAKSKPTTKDFITKAAERKETFYKKVDLSKESAAIERLEDYKSNEDEQVPLSSRL